MIVELRNIASIRALVLRTGVLFLLLVLSAGIAYAGKSTTSSQLQGTAITGANFFVVDGNKYAYMQSNSNWHNEFQNISTQDRIRLIHKESSKKYYGSVWDAEVRCAVEKFSDKQTNGFIPWKPYI